MRPASCKRLDSLAERFHWAASCRIRGTTLVSSPHRISECASSIALAKVVPERGNPPIKISGDDLPYAWAVPSLLTRTLYKQITERRTFIGRRTWNMAWVEDIQMDLAEIFPQSGEYHWEQLCNWSNVSNSLSLTCGRQNMELGLWSEGLQGVFSFSG